jgi:hypothetical protein
MISSMKMTTAMMMRMTYPVMRNRYSSVDVFVYAICLSLCGVLPFNASAAIDVNDAENLLERLDEVVIPNALL